LKRVSRSKRDYLGRVTPEREWSGQFAAPAEAAISDVFGSERIFNGKTSSPTWVWISECPADSSVAMNDGTVLLAFCENLCHYMSLVS